MAPRTYLTAPHKEWRGGQETVRNGNTSALLKATPILSLRLNCPLPPASVWPGLKFLLCKWG